MKRYATLCRVGYWGWLEAECETLPVDPEDDEYEDSYVEYRLINLKGDRLHIGLLKVTKCPSGDFFAERWDEIDDPNPGEGYPSLEAAVCEVAADIFAVDATPFRWVDEPARHKTFEGEEATAFDR
jgi:hypothetical protein